ncbi:MAG: alpha/beta hydrolase [Roseburia sp.]|nr:alpha/beta hydrolase [Roseburia sp.]
MKKNIRHFFLLSALATGTIYGMNKLIDATIGVRKYLNTTSGRFFEWRYGNIFYTKQGDGSPILLIHDLHPASSSAEWEKVIKKLEKDHTVYTLDLLGCGRSDKPNFTYTNYMYVQLITDFVKKIIEEKTDVFATGDSCSFTLMAANMDENIFNRIFLVSPSSLESLQGNPNKKNNFLKNVIEFPIIGTFYYNLKMREQRITQLFERQYYRRKNLISDEIKNTYHEAAHLDGSKGKYLYGSIIANYTNINIIPALKKIKNPIYLIGNRDKESSIHIIDSYVKFDENIETAFISNCNKLPQLEDPKKFFEIVRMFYEN